MKGYEVTLKFLMISFIAPLKSQILMGTPSLFPSFLHPHIMNTPHIQYLWKGFPKEHLDVRVSWHTVHFPWRTSPFTRTISHQYDTWCSLTTSQTFPFCTFPLWQFKFYTSPSSVLRIFRVIWKKQDIDLHLIIPSLLWVKGWYIYLETAHQYE